MEPVLLLPIAMLLAGCSVKKFAINKVGDSLANIGTILQELLEWLVSHHRALSSPCVDGVSGITSRAIPFMRNHDLALTIIHACRLCESSSTRPSPITALSKNFAAGGMGVQS